MAKNTIKALILDMDGVIWRDKHPIGDLPKTFNKIESRGIKYVFATNNSTNTVEKYVELLNQNGIKVHAEQIFTSATATAKYLLKLHPDGGKIYVVGMNGLEKTLQNYGFEVSSDDPLAVVAGMDQNLTYEKLKTATLLIRSGVPFIGTNPDKTFPSPEGLVPGAGSMLAAIQAATDIQPEIIGKPKATMFLQAIETLGKKPENVLVVGDRLETDIAGGQAANCKCGLVLTGVSNKAMGDAWRPQIDYIAETLDTLIDQI
jgi:4-nitrophenyl phosphatase